VFGDAALTPGDAGVHLKFFPDESPLALVVAGSGAAGGWFRPAAGTAWQFDCLPFHEVLSDLSLRADGARPSVVGWRNYRTEDTIVRKRMSSVVSAAMPAAPAVPTASVLWPDQDERDGDAPRPPAPSLGAVLRERWRRVAYVGAAAIGALATYAAIGPRPTRNAGGVGEAAVIAPTLALERRADTLDLALGAFDLRVRLFEARQMTCNDLARGLVQLEDQWMAYNLARRGAPATLDAASLERERAAHARVDDAERRFERSGCARP
jgi:hypothetical protein